MTSEQIENEHRQGRIAGIVGLIGIALFIGSAFAGSADFNNAGGTAEQIAIFGDHRGEILAQRILQAVGIALFAAPLASLFLSARARSQAVRPGLLGVTIVGPLFLAASVVTLYFALDATVAPFLDGGPAIDTSSDDAAQNVLSDQSAYGISQGLGFAGALGLVFGMVYTSLQAMRTGLMTRFLGTLGMALGVAILFIGPVSLLLFSLFASLLVASLLPGGRPPAWEAGVAMPWPKAGEAPASGTGPRVDPDESARPEDFEGSATEVPDERPARRDNKRKRKRKQRG